MLGDLQCVVCLSELQHRPDLGQRHELHVRKARRHLLYDGERFVAATARYQQSAQISREALRIRVYGQSLPKKRFPCSHIRRQSAERDIGIAEMRIDLVHVVATDVQCAAPKRRSFPERRL